MSKALIVVDVQRDFVDGTLAVPDAEAVIPVVERLADQAEILIATRDWHPAGHCSFADPPEFRDGSWPVHCVEFTPGAAFAWEIINGRTPEAVISKGDRLDREAYSGFDGTPLADILRKRDVTEVEVVGLALDYCVKATALDAAREGFDTTVLLEGTRAVADETGEQAIVELREAGVTVR